jgi:2-polyprenyl-3-methyl-5-hydroxy-6-metoxy-1,4-benzoquinol methylase
MREKLIDLYKKVSKHSQYQILPSILQAKLGAAVMQNISRYEEERFRYISQHIDFKDKDILDIGGNTGYFSIEAMQSGARSANIIEGNSSHSEFVECAAKYLNLNISVRNEYWNFDAEFNKEQYNVVFLLNVIHHLGDDFASKELSLQDAKMQMKYALSSFIGHTEILILQLGFCWKGDRTLALFPNGTKREMIQFVEEITSNYWTMDAIGIALEDSSGKTEYREIDNENIERFDTLGEFRNRPLFILKGK